MAGVGAVLRRYREAAGLSQEELAERAGLSTRAISDLERGLRRRPYPATIRRLAQALGLEPRERELLLAAAQRAPRHAPPNQPPAVEQGAYLGARAPLGLVGRQRELAELTDALDRALAGRGRLVLLSGAAGIGKTRLAQEVSAIAETRGWVLATGRCYEPQQGVAFYPFLDALAGLHARAPRAVRQAVPERWPYLERLLPDIFPRSSAARSSSPEELQRLHRATAAFVRACAESSPVALLIDDLQWADSASVELLEHLVRQSQGAPVLIGGIVREPELGAATRVRRALVDLQREGLLQRLRLEPLARAETAALLAQRLGTGAVASDLVDAIEAATDGNPFFAIEVLQTLRARGELVLSGAEWRRPGAATVGVPDTVRESILERFGHLSPTAAGVNEAATTLGQSFGLDMLARLVGLDAEVVESALQEAVDVGFVRALAGDETYAFVHALTHQALYERVPTQRRRRLHLGAAEVLEQVAPTRAAEIAHHLLRANAPARALPYLLLAGDQAEAVFAHEAAIEHDATAARVAAEAGDSAAQAQALVGLGRSWMAGGHPTQALEHFEAAVRIYHDLDDPEGEAEALARIAQVYFARGSWDAGIERLPAVIERLEQRQPSRALARAYACLAAVMPADPAARIGAAARASDLARALGDDDLLVQAEANRGFVLMLAGRLSDARAALEAILPLAQARRVYDALTMIVGSLSELTKLQGDVRGYLRLAERGVARAEESGDQVALVGALSGVAEAEFLLGDWAAARVTYARAAREGSGLDAAWYQGFVDLGLAALDIAEGHWRAADQHLAGCLVASPRLGHHNRREHALRLLAQQHLLGDEPAAALAPLQQVLEAEGDQHPGTQALRAWALVQSDDIAEAAEAAARAVDLAVCQSNELDLCEALLVRGEVERRHGKLDAAGRSLGHGLALARGMPWPYAEGRLRYARARLLADLGQPRAASQELHLAQAIFRRLGARPYLRKADRLAAALASSERLAG